MSGHSHWSSIKHKKGAEDAKRAKIFSKLSRLILVIAKEKGGDIETNAELRMAVEKAKSFNMPQSNIERAIKKGTGEIEGGKLENLLLEGYGPGQIALLIEAVTDSKNRTLAEIRHIVEQFGGKLAGGSVLWMFEKKGVITVSDRRQATGDRRLEKEKLELLAIECGAEDIKYQNDILEIYTKPREMEKIKKILEEKGIEIKDISLDWTPKEEMKISDKKTKEKIDKLFEALDEHDDVQEIYSNLAC